MLRRWTGNVNVDQWRLTGSLGGQASTNWTLAAMREVTSGVSRWQGLEGVSCVPQGRQLNKVRQ